MFLLVFCGLVVASRGSLTQAEKDSMLAWHNKVRQETAEGRTVCSGGNCPSATNMIELQWDEAVAKVMYNVFTFICVKFFFFHTNFI